jgi:DNA-binding transcriptional MocR family regulator
VSRDIPLRYTWFDHLLEIYDKKAVGVTTSVIAVAAALRYHASDKGEAWPSYRTMVTYSGAAKSTVEAAVDHLEQLGYLSVQRAHRRANRYTLIIPVSVPTIGTDTHRRRKGSPPISVPTIGTTDSLSVPIEPSICPDLPSICPDGRDPTQEPPLKGEPSDARRAASPGGSADRTSQDDPRSPEERAEAVRLARMKTLARRGERVGFTAVALVEQDR